MKLRNCLILVDIGSFFGSRVIVELKADLYGILELCAEPEFQSWINQIHVNQKLLFGIKYKMLRIIDKKINLHKHEKKSS